MSPSKKNSLAPPSVVMRLSPSDSSPILGIAEVRRNEALLISSTTTPRERHRGEETNRGRENTHTQSEISQLEVSERGDREEEKSVSSLHWDE